MNNKDIFEKFYAYLIVEKNYSENTVISYKKDLKAFNEYFSVNQPGYPIKVDYDLLREPLGMPWWQMIKKFDIFKCWDAFSVSF
mgnify:CR=1 FL=1